MRDIEVLLRSYKEFRKDEITLSRKRLMFDLQDGVISLDEYDALMDYKNRTRKEEKNNFKLGFDTYGNVNNNFRG